MVTAISASRVGESRPGRHTFRTRAIHGERSQCESNTAVLPDQVNDYGAAEGNGLGAASFGFASGLRKCVAI